MKTIDIILNEERNASMTVYLNQESWEFGFQKRPFMMVLPGGGYGFLSDRESEVIALQYLAAGYQACVLRYTLKDKGAWPYPLNDYDAAMEVIAAHADEWRIDMDHTAVVGFSAGGHLAACAATMATHKPRAAVCVYAAILPDPVDTCQPGLPYPNEYTDSETSPCFIAAARDDRIVPVKNALEFALALEEAGITFELHIYSKGQHGFSTGTKVMAQSETSERVAHWLPDSLTWLGEIMGSLTDNGFIPPVVDTHLNGDAEPYLSLKCSMGHMLKQSAQVQEILEPLYAKLRSVAKERGFTFEDICNGNSRGTVEEMLTVMKLPKDLADRMQAALARIPNHR